MSVNATLTLLKRAATSTSTADLLAGLAESVCELSGADACDIFARDGESLILRASTSSPEYTNRIRLGKGVGLNGTAIERNESLFIADKLASQPEIARYPGVDESAFDSGAVLVIPSEDDTSWGTISLRFSKPQNFSEARKQELLQITEEVGHLIALFNTAYAAGARSNRLGALSEVTKTISSSPYIEEILQLLVQLTAQQFNYVVCTVRLLDEEHGELVLRATQAPVKAYAKKRAIRLGESIAGRAIAENRPIIVEDVLKEEDYIGHDLAAQQGQRSMICIPLTIQDRAIGVMSCYTNEVREFPPDEIEALETLAKQAAVSIEHAKLQVRSTLMQEMHHRVKNNLQQVASLLRLQLRQSHYKTLEESINDCLARILAISSVHDLLSREDLDHVGIRSIAEMLVQHQHKSLILPDRSITFDVRGDDIRLNMAQATQVALVLNELIQNAIEHGFATAVSGEVHITIEAKESEVALWVSNNGDVLPEDFDLAKSSHLGLQIVENLARGLGGKFKISNILGWTVAEVKFTKASLELV